MLLCVQTSWCVQHPFLVQQRGGAMPWRGTTSFCCWEKACKKLKNRRRDQVVLRMSNCTRLYTRQPSPAFSSLAQPCLAIPNHPQPSTAWPRPYSALPSLTQPPQPSPACPSIFQSPQPSPAFSSFPQPSLALPTLPQSSPALPSLPIRCAPACISVPSSTQ